MSENWEKAYKDRCAGMKMQDIADKYNVSINTVKSWKKRHWDALKGAPPKKKKGAPIGNKNATGPPRNQHARKHGLFSKWLPAEINEIIAVMPKDPLDILWYSIEMQYANIIHSLKILYVNDKDDKTKEITMDGDKATVYDIQQAWDKQARNMSALGRSMAELRSLIKNYDELLHKNWDTASEIQRARLAQIQAQTDKIKSDMNTEEIVEDDGFIDAIQNVEIGEWTDEEI